MAKKSLHPVLKISFHFLLGIVLFIQLAVQSVLRMVNIVQLWKRVNVRSRRFSKHKNVQRTSPQQLIEQ